MSCLSLALLLAAPVAAAQSCVTQAKLTPEARSSLADAAMQLAAAVLAGDVARVRSLSSSEYDGHEDGFGAVKDAIDHAAARLKGDGLQVTQLYELVAPAHAAGVGAKVDFTCPLTGSVSETDFAIDHAMDGTYAFAMVEATGQTPWVLSFLLHQESGVWKMVWLTEHARTAAGHDGGWYWNAAFQAARGKHNLLAWLLYGEAVELLQPAAYVTSTKLDTLHAQMQAAAPPEVAKGIGRDAPLVVKSGDGTAFRISRIKASATEDGRQLRLLFDLDAPAAVEGSPDPAVEKADALAAAKALLDTYKELRSAFDSVYVVMYPGLATAAGAVQVAPFVIEQKIADIP